MTLILWNYGPNPLIQFPKKQSTNDLFQFETPKNNKSQNYWINKSQFHSHKPNHAIRIKLTVFLLIVQQNFQTESEYDDGESSQIFVWNSFLSMTIVSSSFFIIFLCVCFSYFIFFQNSAPPSLFIYWLVQIDKNTFIRNFWEEI